MLDAQTQGKCNVEMRLRILLMMRELKSSGRDWLGSMSREEGYPKLSRMTKRENLSSFPLFLLSSSYFLVIALRLPPLRSHHSAVQLQLLLLLVLLLSLYQLPLGWSNDE